MADPAISERAVVHDKGEGDAIWMLGGLYEVLLSAEETGGAVTAVQFTVPAGSGPPPHTHAQNEIVYILEGTATYHIGDEVREVGPGSIVWLPKGTKETFEPTSTLRMIGFYLPGGMDRFFAEAGEPAAERAIPPAPEGPPDIERLASIAARYGLELMAPPEA